MERNTRQVQVEQRGDGEKLRHLVERRAVLGTERQTSHRIIRTNAQHKLNLHLGGENLVKLRDGIKGGVRHVVLGDATQVARALHRVSQDDSFARHTERGDELDFALRSAVKTRAQSGERGDDAAVR